MNNSTVDRRKGGERWMIVLWIEGREEKGGS